MRDLRLVLDALERPAPHRAAGRLVKPDYRGCVAAVTDERLGADMLRDQIGVLAQPVACPFDLDNDGIVEQAVEQRGGDEGIAEHLALL